MYTWQKNSLLCLSICIAISSSFCWLFTVRTQQTQNLPFLKILPTAAFFFFLSTDYMIPRTFTGTSEHIRLLLFSFSAFALFSCLFRAVD